MKDNYVYHRPNPQLLNQVLEQERDTTTGMILHLARYAALIVSEISRLTWDDVDLKKQTLTVKNRTIPIAQPLLSVLLFAKEKEPPSNLILSNKHGAGEYSRMQITRFYRSVLDKIGLNEVRLTDLRIACVLDWLDQYPWEYVSQISGVKRVGLQKHYVGHLCKKQQTKNWKAGATPVKLQKDTIQTLLDFHKQDLLGTIFRLALWADMKNAEMAALTWNDIDFDKGTIQNGNKVIKLPAQLADYMQQWKSLADCPTPNDRVLLSVRSHTPLDSDRISRMARDLFTDVGVQNLTLSKFLDWKHAEEYAHQLRQFTPNEIGLNPAAIKQCFSDSSVSPKQVLHTLERHNLISKCSNHYFGPEKLLPDTEYERLILDVVAQNRIRSFSEIARLIHQPIPVIQQICLTMKADKKIVLCGGHYYNATEIPPIDEFKQNVYKLLSEEGTLTNSMLAKKLKVKPAISRAILQKLQEQNIVQFQDGKYHLPNKTS